jgi:2-phosphosulfolactate phosphatase
MDVLSAHAKGDIIVIVDVLRFSSTVCTAVANGFSVVAFSHPNKAARYSEESGTPMSGPTGNAKYSLSPLDYLNPKAPEEIALVSPNGAALVRMIDGTAKAFIGCFLNSRALGRYLAMLSRGANKGISLIAAGEAAEGKYENLKQRRFAIEDYLGCGAILTELSMSKTAEATVCQRAFESCKHDYVKLIGESLSGKYLSERGFGFDISHCVQRNLYDCIPAIQSGKIAPAEDC